jgi:hypothetical protein
LQEHWGWKFPFISVDQHLQNLGEHTSGARIQGISITSFKRHTIVTVRWTDNVIHIHEELDEQPEID